MTIEEIINRPKPNHRPLAEVSAEMDAIDEQIRELGLKKEKLIIERDAVMEREGLTWKLI